MKIGQKLKKKRVLVGAAVAVAGATGVVARPDKVMQGFDALAALLALF